MLYASKEKIDPTHYQRAKHVVEENKRLHDFSDAVASNNWSLAGDLLYASHHSLKNDYEVSCDELNLLVDTVKDMDGVWGARMMGGGFGGCTINIIKKSEVQATINSVAEVYAQQTAHTLKVHQVKIAQGTHIK
jgi:galactokinase